MPSQSNPMQDRHPDIHGMRKQTPVEKEPAVVTKTRRLLNRWSIFALLFVFSIAVVLFVSNALAVNQLVVDIGNLESEREKLLRQNELLRAKIIALSAPDRITEYARTQLGMIQAATAPKSTP